MIDSFSKYTWVLPLKDKIGITIVNAFPRVLESSKWKVNKIWVDQGSEFYSNSFKAWFNDNDIKMYVTYNEGQLDVAERFIRTLKTKFTNIWQLCQKMFLSMCYMILLIDTMIYIIKQLKINLLILNLILMLNTMLILMIKIQNLK